MRTVGEHFTRTAGVLGPAVLCEPQGITMYRGAGKETSYAIGPRFIAR